MFAMGLQFFGGEETPCKKSAELHLKQGRLLHKSNFTGF
jgi:hypothetical protein